VDLAALLVRVMLELDASKEADKRALLRRLLDGTYTSRDARDVADTIERLVERELTQPRPN
jgi:hypothetical protein